MENRKDVTMNPNEIEVVEPEIVKKSNDFDKVIEDTLSQIRKTLLVKGK